MKSEPRQVQVKSEPRQVQVKYFFNSDEMIVVGLNLINTQYLVTRKEYIPSPEDL